MKFSLYNKFTKRKQMLAAQHENTFFQILLRNFKYDAVQLQDLKRFKKKYDQVVVMTVDGKE